MEKYKPEWAAEICDVPASTIRRLAMEWVETAQIGSTIEIDGEVLPYRPVCINLGKDVNNGLGAYQAEWGSHMLSVLVGGLEVPGGHMSPGARLLEAVERAPETGPRIPDSYGFAKRAFAPTDKEHWQWPPSLRTGVHSLSPLSSWMGAYHLAWKTILDPPEGWPKASVPEVYITHRANPALSQFNLETVRKVLERIPFSCGVCLHFRRDLSLRRYPSAGSNRFGRFAAFPDGRPQLCQKRQRTLSGVPYPATRGDSSKHDGHHRHIYRTSGQDWNP